jgi:YesN/AraC family two-component response regulator
MFLTAYDEIDYLKDALDMKANEFIFKPLNENDFLDKIYHLCK